MERTPGYDPGKGADGPIPMRRLLARIREIMAGTSAPDARLDRIVRLVAAEMVAEVCSCYVRRAGDYLELFATVGLNPRAVHQTKLRIGEGLVGEIAATGRPLATSNAPSHPNFVYRPETDEDPYLSLMGVPIVRDGRVRGVLVIQDLQPRHYHEEEIETLQTIAMAVAEVISVALTVGDASRNETTGNIMPLRVAGAQLNPGLARGVAVPHRAHVKIRQIVADDQDVEMARLHEAVRALHASIDKLFSRSVAANIPESRDILEAFRMIAEDRGWLGRITDLIQTGLTAEAAVQRAQDETATRMAHITDPYLRERLLDFDDLANRLLLHLSGHGAITESDSLPDNAVIVARLLGPTELLEYDHSKMRGLVLEDGSSTSHVTIIARALNIPVVGRCAGILAKVESDDVVIVDGDNGQVFVRPTEDALTAFDQTLAWRAERRRRHAAKAQLPTETQDGVRISLSLNAGLLLDLPHLDETGADGIGLYRTEIPFMVRSEFPDVAVQTRLYRTVLDRSAGKPVTFRTLDVGSDKALPYFGRTDEGNPALGWRAIRIGLDRPWLMRQQLRALIRAADGRPISVMFPMVAEVAEFEAARRLVDLELAHAVAKGVPTPAPLRIGLMLEVPSVLWQLPALLEKADFVAVGSNDLHQYLFAADRSDPELSDRYDTLSPPMLAMLRHVVRQCDAAGVAASVCGEMAARPLEAMALVGLGYRQLSMSSTHIGAIRSMIRSLTVAPLADYVDFLITSTNHSVRERLRVYALDHGIDA